MLASAMTSPSENFYHARPLKSEAETVAFAAKVAGLLRAGDTVTLAGGLGVGKTVFARAIIRRFLPKEEVPSPTFTLVQTYDTPGFPIWHADLYRLKETRELQELGLEEVLERGVLLVEWPDRMGELLARDRLDVILSIPDEDEPERTAQIVARGSWAERIHTLLEQDMRA